MHDLPTTPPDAAPSNAAASNAPPRLLGVPPLQVEVSHTGHCCAVRLGGELDTATAGQLRDALQLVCTGEHDLVMVDLGELRFLGLAGLQVLAEAQHTLQAAGCRLGLGNPDALTRRVLAITGLDQVLPVMSDSERDMSAGAPDA